MNPFRKIDETEQKQREADKKVIENKIKALAELGNYMLLSPQGAKYKEELRKQADDIIKFMIKVVDPDPIKDSFFTRTCLAKLAVLYSLMESIEKDASGRAR